jgi:hypothetical protein
MRDTAQAQRIRHRDAVACGLLLLYRSVLYYSLYVIYKGMPRAANLLALRTRHW